MLARSLYFRMNYTTTHLGPELVTQIMDQALKSINQGEKMAYQMCWDALMSFLSEHWLAVSLFLFALLVVALVIAFFGRWGMLGSVLYNYLYFGTLFVIGLIWGPVAIAGDIVSILRSVLLYPICYFLVGLFLIKIGVR
jgi:hypothetical protein